MTKVPAQLDANRLLDVLAEALAVRVASKIGATNAEVKPAEPIPLLFTYKQVAEMVQLSESTLRQAVKDGRLPCRRDGDAVRFSRVDIDAFISSLKS